MTPSTNAKATADVNLVSLIERFGSEDKCRAYLEGLRWPDGITCPRCDSPKVSRIVARRQFDCDACRYQFSVTAGTVFHSSHLPLWKWFLAVYIMCESKKGVSANQLKRMLGVAYKTAWYLCHRIRSAMTQDTTPLTGIVEADETYVGGKSHSRDPLTAARTRLHNKTVVLGAIERGGNIRLRVVPNARKHHIHGFLDDVMSPDAQALYTDSLRSYRGVTDGDTVHEYVDHSADEWVRGDVHVNGIESAWSLFDRAVIGAYHKLSSKHMGAYLDEFAFRWNNRDNDYLFRDTILALVAADPLAYADLTSGPKAYDPDRR